MTELVQYLSNQPKSRLVTLGFILVVLVGIFDYLTGPELFFSIFYFIPIFLVTWFTIRWIGVLISMACAITWLMADLTSGHVYSHPVIPYWNTMVRLGTFLIITFTLSSLKGVLEHEKELARTDSLTGIANRRYFIELANREVNRAQRYKHPFTIVHMDLDNFKAVNDRFGHSTGDTLLCLVAQSLRNNLRATDTVAHLGGDEFVILLPETGPEQAKVITSKVEKIHSEVMEKNEWSVTLSIGVVTFISPPPAVDEILKISDDLLYTAKNSGKNTIKYEVLGR